MYDEFEVSVKDLEMKQDTLSWSVAQQYADDIIERNRLNKLESRRRVLFLYNALKEHTVDLEHNDIYLDSKAYYEGRIAELEAAIALSR